MDKALSKVIRNHDAPAVESALVQLFVENNHIVVKNNVLIREILADTSSDIIAAKKELTAVFHSKDIVDFVNIFELLVPKDDKKINGAFFTPQFVTDYMVSQVVKNADQTICDPSCGCGAFLIAAASYIAKTFDKSVVRTIEENLYGVDIAEYSVRRAQILLTLLALKNGEDPVRIVFHLKTADSLSSDWDKLFGTTFDVIIGNPPYVKFQDLSVAMRKKLNTDWQTLHTGNFNLYFAFFELGVQIMKKDGVLAYITPNNYFTSLAAVPLRKYLENNRLIDTIVDFNHLKLFAAQTYTCITVLRRSEREHFQFERVESYRTLDALDKLTFSSVNYADIHSKKWRLLRQIDQENIKRIETIGNTLGGTSDIRVGIATCKDAVYFVDGGTLEGKFYTKLYKGKSYAIEKTATKPVAKISDFKNQSDLDANERRIIFPYQRVDGKTEIIPEDEFKRRYPRCYQYLLTAKDELATRDKGKVEYPAWYAYARTQGLNFFGKKLLTPTFSKEPRFLIEQDEEALFCNGYAVCLEGKQTLFAQGEGKLNLEVLGKILNSRVMDYYVKKTSVSIDGGYPCYQKNFIELFGIPDFSDKDILFLEKETDREAIDAFLVKKYALTI